MHMALLKSICPSQFVSSHLNSIISTYDNCEITFDLERLITNFLFKLCPFATISFFKVQP